MKIIVTVVASLVMTVLLGLSGCGEDEHRDRFHGNREHETVIYQRQNEGRHVSDRHEDRAIITVREGEHHD
jgi:uncharacterized lipoprotein YehR (DUF1307 family)